MVCLTIVLLVFPGSVQADKTSDFLAAHWQDPPIASAPVTATWDPLSRAFSPDGCGACHGQQLADWRGSRHSRATGAGLEVQARGDPVGMDSCSRCHAPLVEQRPAAGGRAGNPLYRPAMRTAGLYCVSCHVRRGQVYGPPRRRGVTASTQQPPHDGFVARDAFTDSRFCATCHQFAQGVGVYNGKPIENTFAEWQRSPQATQGQQCQHCHMPDRRHLFRGIHDPQMTASAFSVSLRKSGYGSATYAVQNTGAAHMVPTYITPRLQVVVAGFDGKGKELGRKSYTIQRKLDVYLKGEQFDTRLAPGASVKVEYSWWPWQNVREVRAWIEVAPDEYYQRFFTIYQPAGIRLQPLLDKVRNETRSSAFVVHQQSLLVE